MLESIKDNSIEIGNMKDLTTVIFVIIDDIYKEVMPEAIKKRLHNEKSKLSDSEIITISIIGELQSHDTENAWLSYVKKNMRDLFPMMCERSRFNRKRRKLLKAIEIVRVKLNTMMSTTSSDLRIIDSFPIPVCEFGRAKFCKSFKGYDADYGYCPSKKLTYYGYKVHAMCTGNGYITDFVITPASTDDREAVWDLVEEYNRHLYLIGDKGYISPRLADDLRDEKGIDLIYMKRNNAKNQYPKPFRQRIFKIPRRIETSFSQLAEQLNVESVHAKSFWGLAARLQTKILAFNVCFFINQLLAKVEDIAKIMSLVF